MAALEWPCRAEWDRVNSAMACLREAFEKPYGERDEQEISDALAEFNEASTALTTCWNSVAD